eukprot:gene11079-7708_t
MQRRGDNRRTDGSETAFSRHIKEEMMIRRIVNESRKKKKPSIPPGLRVCLLVLLALLLTSLSAGMFWKVVAGYMESAVIPPKRQRQRVHAAGTRSALSLSGSLAAFKEVKSIPTFQSLALQMLRVGDDLARLLPTAEDETAAAGLGTIEVPLLVDSATAMYMALNTLLTQKGPSVLPFRLGDFPETVYHWSASALYILNRVLPEFYVHHPEALDDKLDAALSSAHTGSLLKANNLLHAMQGSLVDLLPRGGDVPWCQGLVQPPDDFLRFCEASLNSKALIARRVAANYEELIALQPRYGPFRLHYAASYLALRDFVELGFQRSTCREVIRKDRARVRTYAYSDEFHVPLLNFMEMFMLSAGDGVSSPRNNTTTTESTTSHTTRADVSATAALLDVLQALPDCSTLIHPGGSATWPSLAVGERVQRPPLIEPHRLRHTMEQVQHLLPDAVFQQYTHC